jgi:hypothetical protein
VRASQPCADASLTHSCYSIEDVARDDPSAIITVPIDFENGLSMEVALETAKKLGFEQANEAKAADVFIKLYKLFKDKDATQIEINPLAEVEGGEVLCMDAKLGFDENAEFRQEVSLFVRSCLLYGSLPFVWGGGGDGDQEGEREERVLISLLFAHSPFSRSVISPRRIPLRWRRPSSASTSSSSTVPLGASLTALDSPWRRWTCSTSTVEALPTSLMLEEVRLTIFCWDLSAEKWEADFVCAGFAGATAEAVKKAFELLLSEKAVKSIFVNIFGGMWVSSFFSINLFRR